MKKIILAALLFATSALGAKAQTLVQSFENIEFWTGHGGNRSALVLQWNDGGTPTSMAWGYRWTGNVTGIDMLKAIAGSTVVTAAGDSSNVLETSSGADSRMTLSIQSFGFGDSIYSITFNDGLSSRNRADWASGYWAYSILGGNFSYDNYDASWNYLGVANYSQSGTSNYSSVNWFSSPIGASDRELVDGSWDAFAFAPGLVTNAVVQPFSASVPEPGVAIFITISLAFFLLRWRRRILRIAR